MIKDVLIASAIFLSVVGAVVSMVVARNAQSEVRRLRSILDISPNGGLTVSRLVVKDDVGNSVVLQPGGARFFSPANGKPGNPGVIITAMGKPYVSIVNADGKERVVLGVVHTRETESGNETISGEGSLTFFNTDGVKTFELP